MTRVITFLLATMLFLVAGLVANDPGESNDKPDAIGKLESERLQLLQKRVELVDSLFELGHIGVDDRTGPKMDLIEAKIEYAKSNDEKRKLIDELLKLHDVGIEIAEARQNSGDTALKFASATGNDLLYLKSERIKVQIEREKLE